MVALTLDAKSAPGQAYDQATMIDIGRKFDLKSASLLCLQVWLGDPEASPSPVNTVDTFPTTGASNNTKSGPNVAAIVGGTLQNVNSG
jgi:hypothetical protein